MNSTDSGKLLVNEREAARMLSICPRTLWGMAARGEVPVVRLGSRKLYSIDSLRQWGQNLEADAVATSGHLPAAKPSPLAE